MLAEGRLPALGDLRRRGRWERLDASATILQSSTYPTLCTGVDVLGHGIYSAYPWSAADQRVRFSAHRLNFSLAPVTIERAAIASAGWANIRAIAGVVSNVVELKVRGEAGEAARVEVFIVQPGMAESIAERIDPSAGKS